MFVVFRHDWCTYLKSKYIHCNLYYLLKGLIFTVMALKQLVTKYHNWLQASVRTEYEERLQKLLDDIAKKDQQIKELKSQLSQAEQVNTS